MTETKRKIGTQAGRERLRDQMRTESWLTREQVSSMLNVSTVTVKNLENAGKLTPARASRRVADGSLREVMVYDPDEVAKVPGRQRGPAFREPGAVFADVYSLLDEGKTIREIVLRTCETSDRVREIRDRWIDDGGNDRVLAPPAWEALEGVIGKFASVTDLVERVTELAKRAAYVQSLPGAGPARPPCNATNCPRQGT